MTITRNIAPLLAALQKQTPEPHYLAKGADRYGDDVSFTDREYRDAKKVHAYDLDDIISGYDRDDEMVEVDGDELSVLTDAQVKDIIKRLQTPTVAYTLYSDDVGDDVTLSEDAYLNLGIEDKSYSFNVHGWESTLTKDYLKIGCQEHTLDEWDLDLDELLERQYGYESNLTEMIQKQWQQAKPVFEKLQAKLLAKPKAKAKKKTAKKKAKKR